MWIRAGYRLINTDNIVEIYDWPATEEKVVPEGEEGDYDLPAGHVFPAQPRRTQLVTTAIETGEVGYEGQGGYSSSHYTIHLHGDAAEEFMGALIVYGPLGVES